MTRDKNRIPKVLEAIKLIWELVPDQRLGQLIHNLAQFNEIKEKDVYYLEDEELIEKIHKAIKQKRLQ